MKAIVNNPFRIISIPSNTRERELQKQIRTLNRYQEINQIREFDYDFPILGILNRSNDAITAAISSINSDLDKLKSAVFWFVSHNDIDEIAFNNLRKGFYTKALEIWETSIGEEHITTRNFSSFNNASVIYLWLAFKDDLIDYEKLARATHLKNILFSSTFFNDYCNLIVSNGANVHSVELLNHLVNTIFNEHIHVYYLEKNYIKHFITIFDNYPASIKQQIISRLTFDPIQIIEKEISSTFTLRSSNESNSYYYGLSLYNATKNHLSTLYHVLGDNDLTYKMIAGKLSAEILQCGIDYFNSFKDDPQNDPGEKTLEILKIAKSIGFNTISKSRIEENYKIIEEWVLSTPSRAKMNEVSGSIDFIIKRLKSFQELPASVSMATALLDSTASHTNIIRNKLGDQSKQYIFLVTAIAKNVDGMCTYLISDKISKLQTSQIYRDSLLSDIREAIPLYTRLLLLNIDAETRTHIVETHKTLISILKSATSTNNSNSGCFIATAVYGSYENTQVLILRNFRDSVLAENIFGRLFIKLYYICSPPLATKIKKYPKLKSIVKKLLDLFIRSLS